MRLPIIALAVACVGCGGGVTSPKFPALAGGYSVVESAVFDNSAAVQNGTLTVTMTVSLDVPDASGNFTGSYVFTGNATGSGPIAGTERQDGGITITEFGSASLYEDLAFLQNTWPNCNFGDAAGSGETGAVSGNSLAFSGTLTFPCAYQDQSGQVFNVPTTLTASFTGTRQ